MKKAFQKTMFITLSIILLLVLVVVVFIQQDQFGKLPSGTRLARIQQSPNYRNGAFQNQHHTPDLTEGASYYSVMKEFFFTKKENLKPINKLPTQKTDLFSLKSDENVLIWFGHSSYFMQIDGKKILVDPVFSGAASPLSFTTKAFAGTDVYSTDDIPEIDYLFITHDHWDHLDYKTIVELKPKIKQVICGLGTGEHLVHWGFDSTAIVEEDWDTKITLSPEFTVYTTPARHFSGRGFKRNQALWTSFALYTPNKRIYIGGDSGYDTHFAEIGKQHGPFDLTILENGQYDKSWKYIHMMPEEVVQAAIDLQSANFFPVHSGKFALGNHAWNEPLKRIHKAADKEKNTKMITPVIGEKVLLDDSTQQFSTWWENIK